MLFVCLFNVDVGVFLQDAVQVPHELQQLAGAQPGGSGEQLADNLLLVILDCPMIMHLGLCCHLEK